MPAVVKTNMPSDVDIGQGYTLRIAALAPADGSTVAGVKISNMTLEVQQLTTGSLESGPFMYVLGPGA